MPEIRFGNAINRAVVEALAEDPTVFVFGENVAEAGGPFGVTRGLYERFGFDRVRDTPISESCIANAAVGAALTGIRPVLEIRLVADERYDLLACRIEVDLGERDGQLVEELLVDHAEYAYDRGRAEALIRRIGRESGINEKAYERLGRFAQALPDADLDDVLGAFELVRSVQAPLQAEGRCRAAGAQRSPSTLRAQDGRPSSSSELIQPSRLSGEMGGTPAQHWKGCSVSRCRTVPARG
jgi:hypothetical protein